MDNYVYVNNNGKIQCWKKEMIHGCSSYFKNRYVGYENNWIESTYPLEMYELNIIGEYGSLDNPIEVLYG